MPPTLPNLIIIGAAKCGTTSLHSYLSKHPLIYMSKQKELSFFFKGKQFTKGLEWYKAQFDANFVINGESSPLYTRYPRAADAPKMIHRHIPNVRLLYLIRDPIDRLVSHYTYFFRESLDLRSFSEVIADRDADRVGYFSSSMYFKQLSRYLAYFDREQIHIVVLEQLVEQPETVMRGIFEFLRVEGEIYDWSVLRHRHNAVDDKLGPNMIVREYLDRIYPWMVNRAHAIHWRLGRGLRQLARVGGRPVQRPDLQPDDERLLIEFFRDDVAALRKEAGVDVARWRSYLEDHCGSHA